MTTKPRVLLADDHRIFLEGLEKLLRSEFEIVGTAEDGEALVAAAGETECDAMVIDFSMPSLNGLEALREIRARGIGAPVVMLTMHDSPSYAAAALREGVSGYVLKQSASVELVGALHEALAGKTWISPAIAGDVVRAMQEPEADASALTDRQIEILRLLVKGLIAKQIATQLDISPRTVEYHKYRMMRQLGFTNTAELIQYAVREGFDSETKPPS